MAEPIGQLGDITPLDDAPVGQLGDITPLAASTDDTPSLYHQFFPDTNAPKADLTPQEKENIQLVANVDNPLNLGKALGEAGLNTAAAMGENFNQNPLGMGLVPPGTKDMAQFIPALNSDTLKSITDAARGGAQDLHASLPPEWTTGALSGSGIAPPKDPGILSSLYKQADGMTSLEGMTNLGARVAGGPVGAASMLPEMGQGIAQGANKIMDPAAKSGEKWEAGTDIASQALLPLLLGLVHGGGGEAPAPEVAPGGDVPPPTAPPPSNPDFYQTHQNLLVPRNLPADWRNVLPPGETPIPLRPTTASMDMIPAPEIPTEFKQGFATASVNPEGLPQLPAAAPATITAAQNADWGGQLAALLQKSGASNAGADISDIYGSNNIPANLPPSAQDISTTQGMQPGFDSANLVKSLQSYGDTQSGADTTGAYDANTLTTGGPPSMQDMMLSFQSPMVNTSKLGNVPLDLPPNWKNVLPAGEQAIPLTAQSPQSVALTPTETPPSTQFQHNVTVLPKEFKSIGKLINEALTGGEKGQVNYGKATLEDLAQGLKESSIRQEAQRELANRAWKLAKDTGQDASQLFQEALKNPMVLAGNTPSAVAPVPGNDTSEVTPGTSPNALPSMATGLPKDWKAAGLSMQEANRGAFKYAKAEIPRINEQRELQEQKPLTKYEEKKEISSLYNQAREAQGLVRTPDSMGVQMKDWKNSINAANDVEKETGVEAGGYMKSLIDGESKKSYHLKDLMQVSGLQKLQDAFRQLKVPDKEVTRLLRYVGTSDGTPEGTPEWKPSALTSEKDGKVITEAPAFTGPMPSPEVLQNLFKMRKAYDAMYQVAAKEKPDIPYRDRYVSVADKIPIISGAAGDQSVYKPPFMRERSFKEGGPKEENIWKLSSKYMHQLANHMAYADVLPQGRDVSLQLRMLGKDSVADRIDGITANAMGLGNVDALNHLRVEDIKDLSEPELNKLRVKMNLDPSRWDKFSKWMEDQMYHSFVGKNLQLAAAHFFKAEMGAAPEIGLGNLERHSIGRIRTPLEEKALSAVKERLRATNYNVLESETPTQWGKAGNVGSEILKATGKPGMKWIDVIDKARRDDVFLGARRQFLKTKSVSKVIGDMMEFEKQSVRDALKVSPEQAAREYGILRAQRAMHRFSSVDKPWVLQQGMLKNKVPFTTFGRSELMKLIEDANRYKNPANLKMFAKRIGYSLVMTAVLNGAHSGLGTYTNPYSSIPKIFQAGLTPVLKGPAEGAEKGSLIKNTIKMFATPDTIMNLGKKHK